MPIIRRKYHYGAYYLNPQVVGDKFQLGGQTVDVKTKTCFERVHFLGFKSYVNEHAVRTPVMIINVAAYSSGDEYLWQRWIEYCRYTVLLGERDTCGVHLVLTGEEKVPVAWCPIQKPDF